MTLQMGLKLLGSTITILLGVLLLLQPKNVRNFTELEPANPQGKIELRAVMGGTLIGIGLAAFLFPVLQVYKSLAITFFAITAVRGVMMIIDKSINRSNLISLLISGVLAVLYYL